MKLVREIALCMLNIFLQLFFQKVLLKINFKYTEFLMSAMSLIFLPKPIKSWPNPKSLQAKIKVCLHTIIRQSCGECISNEGFRSWPKFLVYSTG